MSTRPDDGIGREGATEMVQNDEIAKAYENREFLHSPAARAIRVLCELKEPEERFRRHKIRNTIVFFGSTHALSRQEAEKNRGEGEKGRYGMKLAEYYEAARELAAKLTRWSNEIADPGRRFYICSGGGPGIMEAANRGTGEGGGKPIGLNISLLMDQPRNIYQDAEVSFEFHYFFIRKFWFFYLAKALVIFPGGYGTLDELFELLTLVQTEKSKKYMPIIIYGAEYWREVLNFEALVKWGTIKAEDMKLFRMFDDVDAAFAYLTQELTEHYLG